MGVTMAHLGCCSESLPHASVADWKALSMACTASSLEKRAAASVRDERSGLQHAETRERTSCISPLERTIPVGGR